MNEKWRGAAVAAAIVAALVGLRVAIERTDEHRRERETLPSAGAAPGEVLFESAAAQVLGGMRAFFINGIWVAIHGYHDEKRYFEAAELADHLRYFQPNNEEVWTFIGWERAYNISLGRDTPDEQWEWVRKGLDMVEAGIRRNPRFVSLHLEAGSYLSHRVSQDRDLIRRAEASLGESPFRRAVAHFGRGIEEMRAQEDRLPSWNGSPYYVTPGGLVLYPEMLDRRIKVCLFLDAWWRLSEHRDAPGAQAAFREAAAHARGMLERYAAVPGEDILRKDIEFYDAMAEACPGCSTLWALRAEGRPEEARAAALALWRAVMPSWRGQSGEESQFLVDLLRETARDAGLDGTEPNDNFDFPTRLRQPGVHRGAIAPDVDDVDLYRVAGYADYAGKVVVHLEGPGTLTVERRKSFSEAAESVATVVAGTPAVFEVGSREALLTITGDRVGATYAFELSYVPLR